MTVLPGITADELRRRLEEEDDLVLVDALAPMVYAHSHLPGAINIPPANVDPTRLAKRIPDLAAPIVVYCANLECEDSVETAEKLRALGYTNVVHFAGGKEEWKELGLPLERAGKPYVPQA